MPPPWSILSFTFTTRAHTRLRHRIEQLLGISPQGMWVAPFTAWPFDCFARTGKEAGLASSFQILTGG